MRFYILITFLFVSLSQANGYDSLETALRLHQSSQFQKALPFLISLSKRYLVENDIANYTRCQVKIADIIRAYGGPRVALMILDKTERLLKVKVEKPSWILSEILLMKAECLFDIGSYEEYNRTINESVQNRKFLSSPDDIPTTEFMHRAKYYQNVPNRRDSVEFWAKESLRLAKSNRSKFIYVLPRIYTLLGFHVHLLNNNYYNNKIEFYKIINTSRAYYDSSMRLVKMAPLTDSIMLGRIYHNLGNSYNNEAGVTKKRETFDKAIRFYHQSIAIAEKFGSPSELAMKDWVLAVAYERLKIRDSSLLVFQNGMTKLMPEFTPKSLRDIPPVVKTFNDKLYATFPTQMFNQFHLKYKEQGKIDDLISAYHYGIYCIQFYQYLVSLTKSEQETMNGTYLYIDGTYQRLAEVTSILSSETGDKQYLEKAYPYLVSAKYAFLNKSNVDNTKKIKENLAYFATELDLVKKSISRNNPGLTIQHYLTDLVVDQNQPVVGKSQKKEHSIRLDDSVTIKRLQETIKGTNTAIIDFYSASSNFRVVTITENHIDITSYRSQKKIIPLVWGLRKQMVKLKPQEYAKLSYEIYNIFLDSALTHLPKSINKLIICPDEWLLQIPWEALVTDSVVNENTSYRNLPYLNRKYQTHIVLSLKQLLSEQQSFSQDFIGVTSDFKDSKRFSSLPFSSRLVKSKAKDYHAEVRNKMPPEINDLKIFHLAAHLRTDSLRPFLSTLFLSDSDSVLLGSATAHKSKIGLAILNACASSGLSSYAGEGTIGFARAFYAAGAQSVLMTLWSVDDKTTADILTNFYENMESGNSLDHSLQKAKLDFIEQAPTDDLANPFYWAGLQLSGKTDPLFEKSYNRSIVLSLVGISLVLGGIYFVRRKGRVIA